MARETCNLNLEGPDTSRRSLTVIGGKNGLTCQVSDGENPSQQEEEQAGGCSKGGGVSLTLSSQIAWSSSLGNTGLGKARRPALQLKEPHNWEFPGDPCPPPGPCVLEPAVVGKKQGRERRTMGLLPSLHVSMLGYTFPGLSGWRHLNQRPQGSTMIWTSGRPPKKRVRYNSRLSWASLTSFLSLLSLEISEARSSGSLIVIPGPVQRAVFELCPQVGGSHPQITYN